MHLLVAAVAVSSFNLAILAWVIRNRGLLSFEGLGLGLLFVAISSDLFGLLLLHTMSYDAVESRTAFHLRIFPGLVHALGIMCFFTGLLIANPKPQRVPRAITSYNRQRVKYAAYFLIVFGLTMKLVALLSSGVSSLYDYLTNAYYYTVYQSEYGGFLHKGVPISLFGFSLLSATQGTRPFRQIFILVIMILISFSLTTSRADLVGTLVILAFTTASLNPSLLRTLWRRRICMLLVSLVLGSLVVINAGIKSQARFLSSQDNIVALDSSLVVTSTWGISRILDRFSHEGLYGRYCNLATRLYDDPGRFFDGRVGTYALTAWLPYVVYRDKPQHPFRDVGDLVNTDFHTSVEEVSASMLVGSALSDWGLLSLTTYLFVYGVLLGVIRTKCASMSAPILLFVFYLHLTLVDGATNMIHGGIVNFIPGLALACSVMLLAVFYVKTASAAHHAITTVAICSSRSTNVARSFHFIEPRTRHSFGALRRGIRNS